VGHGTLEIGLTDSSQAEIVEPAETDARIRRKLDRLVPHGPVAIDRQDGGVLRRQHVLERQGEFARLPDVASRRLHDRLGVVHPPLGLGVGQFVIHRLIGVHHRLKIDLLDLRAELGLHAVGVGLEDSRRDVEHLGLPRMMNRAEGADSSGKLRVVGGQEALQPGPDRLALQGAEARPLVPGVREGKKGRRLAHAKDLAEDRRGAHAQMNSQNAVDVLQAALEPARLIDGCDQLIDDELHVAELICEPGELGFIGADLLLEVQRRFGPVRALDSHVDPSDLNLAGSTARADQRAALRGSAGAEQARPGQVHHSAGSGDLQELATIDLPRHGLAPSKDMARFGWDLSCQ